MKTGLLLASIWMTSMAYAAEKIDPEEITVPVIKPDAVTVTVEKPEGMDIKMPDSAKERLSTATD